MVSSGTAIVQGVASKTGQDRRDYIGTVTVLLSASFLLSTFALLIFAPQLTDLVFDEEITPTTARWILAPVAVTIFLALARGVEPAWRDLPSGPPNTSLRVVAARLFGGSLPRTLPRRLFVHQGLLQIHADFCLRDHGECSQCRFPSLVSGLTA